LVTTRLMLLRNSKACDFSEMVVRKIVVSSQMHVLVELDHGFSPLQIAGNPKISYCLCECIIRVEELQKGFI
jgi:hypothetical protein